MDNKDKILNTLKEKGLELVSNIEEYKNRKSILKVKCLKCGDIIESVHRHDFVTCSCGNVSVDGGKDYLRRCFQEKDSYIEMSETEEVIDDAKNISNEN